MKYLIALVLFLGTITGSAQASLDGERSLIGRSVAGYVFLMEGYKNPWVCRTQGTGKVECDTEIGTVLCKFEDQPVYFSDCTKESNEAPIMGSFNPKYI